jgi:hypothetical protein
MNMEGGVQDCLEEPQSFSYWIQCSRVVSDQGAQKKAVTSLPVQIPALSCVSEQSLNKFPSLSEQKTKK